MVDWQNRVYFQVDKRLKINENLVRILGSKSSKYFESKYKISGCELLANESSCVQDFYCMAREYIRSLAFKRCKAKEIFQDCSHLDLILKRASFDQL